MAQIIQIGEPVNDGEVKVIAHLRNTLPNDYIVLHNLDIADRPNARPNDLDAIVIGEYAVYAIEIKDWRGTIIGNIKEWQLSASETRPNPVAQIQYKARVLHSYLTKQAPSLKNVEVVGLVVIVDDKTSLRLDHNTRAKTFKLNSISNILTNKNFLPNSYYKLPILSHPLREKIRNTIYNGAKSTPFERRFRDYLVVDEWDTASEDYEEFIAQHEHLRRRKVKLRVYYVDPYLSAAVKKREQQRIYRESLILTELDEHYNIVKVYESFPYENDKICIVTEWFGGGRSLQNLLNHHQDLHPNLKREIVRQIGEGLAFSHRNGVIHRNISSEAVLVTESGYVKLTNFELSRSPSVQTAATNALKKANKRYMSPEQYLDPHSVDRRSDIYSFGIVLYEILTGTTPYDSVMQRLRNLDDSLFLSKATEQGLKKDLIQVIQKMVRFSPEERFTSVNEALAEIMGLL